MTTPTESAANGRDNYQRSAGFPIGAPRTSKHPSPEVDAAKARDKQAIDAMKASGTAANGRDNLRARWRCPVHHVTDCSPLLNGCTLLVALHKSPAYWVDIEQALSAVEDTYTPDGVAIWWAHWLKQDEPTQLRLLRDAEGYGGMVAT